MYKLFDADSVRHLFQQMQFENYYYRIPEYCEFIKESLSTAALLERIIIQHALEEELRKLKDIAFGGGEAKKLRLMRLLVKQLNKVIHVYTQSEIDDMYRQALAQNPADKDAELYCKALENKPAQPLDLEAFLLDKNDNNPQQSEEILLTEEPPLKLINA